MNGIVVLPEVHVIVQQCLILMRACLQGKRVTLVQGLPQQSGKR